MNEPTDEEILLQAQVCPVIRGVYLTEDTAAIKRTEEMHPPSMCWHVKNAGKESEMSGQMGSDE